MKRYRPILSTILFVLNLQAIIIAITIAVTREAEAAQSMRHCLLLPILDSSSTDTGTGTGGIGFQIFEKVEKYLKESDSCTYRSNFDIMDLLKDYKNNLHAHLQDPELLKLLAEKSKAGSLIKIQVEKASEQTHVSMSIIGENGEDIYFRKKTRLNTNDSFLVSLTIRNWLDSYGKAIPYQGRIVGILGDQFTVDMGKLAGSYPKAEVIISRPLRKKIHPLLKKVVEWKTWPIAKGEIRYTSRSQSQGVMTTYYSDKYRPKLGDWANLKEIKTRKKSLPNGHKKENDGKGLKNRFYKFGRIGELSFLLNFGVSSINDISKKTQKAQGPFIGTSINAEVWATRLFWSSVEMWRALGKYSSGRTKFKVGYRYLPLGFFYGPRIDAYMGYARYSYSPSTRIFDDFFPDVAFKGFLFGIKGSLPVHKFFRFSAIVDFIISPGYEEDIPSYGQSDSTSSYNIEIGGVYNYTPTMQLTGSFVTTSHSATFKHKKEKIEF